MCIRDRDKFNEKLGVSKAQEQAMLAGSMIRWESIAANDGKAIENDLIYGCLFYTSSQLLSTPITAKRRSKHPKMVLSLPCI